MQEDVKNTNTEEVKEEVVEETTENTETSEETEAKADPKDEQIAELQNRMLRLQADFDNYRRRTNTEKEQLSTFVTANVVSKFLKVLDNFERAEASVTKTKDIEGVIEGMKHIRRQFEDTFKELNVVEIEAEGQKFDPNLHEAVMRSSNPELEDETIDMVFEKGYKIYDKVIRHSKVRVNSNE